MFNVTIATFYYITHNRKSADGPIGSSLYSCRLNFCRPVMFMLSNNIIAEISCKCKSLGSQSLLTAAY